MPSRSRCARSRTTRRSSTPRPSHDSPGREAREPRAPAPPARDLQQLGLGGERDALKLIRAYWKLRGTSGKTKVLSRTFAYHGVGLATTSLTGLPSCTDPFDLPLPGFVRVPGPHSYGSGKSHEDYAAWCLAETERAIEREGPHTIAAFFAEPVQGAGGVIVPPPGHLAALRALCRRHEILFVADEVITGFGRLGAWFASGLWDLEPDLLTVAKGITSGYLPLGATLVSGEIASVLEAGGTLAHGFTYTGHPRRARPRSPISTSSSASGSSSACATTSGRASRPPCARSATIRSSPTCAASA
jgi:hypothetical protein